ncbi:MAG: hypothetical protein HY902_01105 [Deltaproteobacteria bacterium]|nr:hypothetical protein [Deltaproteobacteria bacterium]
MAKPSIDPAWRRTSRELAIDLQRLLEQFSGTHAAVLERLVDRLRLPRPGQKPGLLSHLTLPIALLPVYTAQRLAKLGLRVPAKARRSAVLAAVSGYLAVRLHDDRLDEGLGSEADAILVGSALLAHHWRCLIDAAGPRGAQPMAQLAATAWTRYAAAMELEAAVARAGQPWTQAAWLASLDRYAPMALPSAALLLRGGRQHELADHDAMLLKLGEAHQIFEDAVDAQADAAAGRPTWVGQRLAGDEDSAFLGTAGGMGEAIQWAERALGEATAIAETLGDTALLVHIAGRRQDMRAWLDDAVTQLVASLRRALATTPPE